MKKMTLSFGILLAVISCLVVDPSLSFAQKKPIVLRLVTSTPPRDYPMGDSLEDMAERFNARAKGEYTMEVYSGGALAKLPEYLDAVRIGAVEMASAPWTMFAFLDPRLGAIEAPYLWNSMAAANDAVAEILPLYDEILQKKFNAKALSMFDFGFSELVSVKPIRTIEDLRGTLIAAISPTVATLIKDLGGAPVTIMWTDLYESLQKNIVDGTMFQLHPSIVMNLVDVCKEVTISYPTSAFIGLSVNLDIYKKMPTGIQTILTEEARSSHRWMIDEYKRMVQKDLAVFKQKGVTLHALAPEERARWVELSKAQREKMLATGGDFGEKIRKIADDSNKKYPYHVDDYIQ